MTLDTAGLQELLTSGQTVLLPHAHAARTLRARTPTSTPPRAWHEWTSTLWSDLLLNGADDRLLLNRLQEDQLWTDVLAAHLPNTTTAASLRDLTPLARAALRRAADHRLIPRLRPEADTPDSRTFAAAAEHLLDLCHRQRLLPSALLDDALATHLRAGSLPAPNSLHLIDFAQPTPAQQHLLAALESTGTTLHHHTLQHPNTPVRRSLTAADPHHELRLATRLIAHHARTHPTPTVALICPDPTPLRPELERLFRELLAPELESVHADLSSTPWHFAAQPPLASTPIIAAALDLLRWTLSPLPLERIGQLLLSPFLAHAGTAETRAQLELRALRRAPILRPALDLANTLPLFPPGAPIPELHTLARAAAALNQPPTRRSHAIWADAIRRLLHTVGWPGPRTLSPAEFAALQAWEGLLDQLATLDFNGARLPFADFLDLLAAEARTLPLPAVNPAAPLQIVTLPQTEALLFDLTLVLDATDRHLPLPEPPHPLLPQNLQRRLGLGDPTQALTHARAALECLTRRSATALLLASAAEDGAPAQLTPLAAQLAFTPTDPNHLLPPEPTPNPLATDPIPQPELLPLLQDVEVHGGADVLRDQAACGFRAFAARRLAAAEPRAQTLGLDFRDLGSILHSALQDFWSKVHSHAELQSLTPAERRDRIAQAVQAALAKYIPKPQPDDPWSTRFLALLLRRYTTLLLRWLALELQRSPFTVIAQETPQTLTLGPIRLTLRPDRIDQIDTGQVFVDYKSAYELSASDWLDSRPDAPQLPAYALTADPATLRGIAFAQIRPGEDSTRWISLSDQPGLFPKRGNKPLNPDQLALWRTELTILATAFAHGDTRVNPKTYPKTCQYCAHRALCRLDPATLLDQLETDDDELTEEELADA